MTNGRNRTTALTLALLASLTLVGCSRTSTRSDATPEAIGAAHEEEFAQPGENGMVTDPESPVANAIETLDQQGAEHALVTELDGAHKDAETQEVNDLFDRIRAGFALSDVDHEWVTREEVWLAKHPDYLDRTFRRGERYLYHIVTEIEARGMPLELALLPVVESAFNPVAYSRAHAAGLWQFIPSTGVRYGLKQNWYYDGRRDVLEATRAALDYLSFLSKEFDGDWLLAVAAYNCGELAVARAIERNRAEGEPTDFFSLKLPRETRAYVPKLLAMRRIVADPASHNLAFAPIPNRPYFVKVDVAGQIDLQVAAELAELPKEELLALNPSFNYWVTDPEGPHYLLLPVQHHERFVTALADLPPQKRVRVVYHRVRSGESLGAIARRYGVSVAALKVANGIKGTTIHAGQDLVISTAPRGVMSQTFVYANQSRAKTRKSNGITAGRHVVRNGETLWSISRRHGVSLDRLARTNSMDRNDKLVVGQVLKIPGTATLASSNPAAVVAGQQTTYVVRAGDTLSRIAQQYHVSVKDLLGWNNLRSAHVLKPGQRLVMFRNN